MKRLAAIYGKIYLVTFDKIVDTMADDKETDDLKKATRREVFKSIPVV